MFEVINVQAELYIVIIITLFLFWEHFNLYIYHHLKNLNYILLLAFDSYRPKIKAKNEEKWGHRRDSSRVNHNIFELKITNMLMNIYLLYIYINMSSFLWHRNYRPDTIWWLNTQFRSYNKQQASNILWIYTEDE